MILTRELEYIDKNGEDQLLIVEFEAEPRMVSDNYYGGYASLEDNGEPTWQECCYTDEENEIIEKFKSDKIKWENLCEQFCLEYKCEVKHRKND